MQGFIFPNGKLLKVGYPFEPGCLVEEESGEILSTATN